MGQARASRICQNCGTANSANDDFCSNCGYALNSGSPAYPTVQASIPAPTIQTPSPSPATNFSRRTTGALTAGSLLGGRYRVSQMIGKGGFGAVYKANDERFQKRVVAVKEMSDAQLTPQQRMQAIQDFRNEAELLVELNHPNLPNVSDFFEEGNKAYLVMEFIEGKTLEKVQEDAGGPLDEHVVMGWALQLCNVLHYLHTRPHPIIFRDMKPSNVMITADDEIKLIDFGIARIFKAAVTKDTTLLGSQGYAPLEQYGRGQSDARSDIYALGATLYDLMTNNLPADSPSRRINPQIFVRPRQLNSRISPATEAIILKAMADDPKDRYQSAAEMYQAISSSGIATTGNIIGSPTLSGVQSAPVNPRQQSQQTQQTVVAPPRRAQQPAQPPAGRGPVQAPPQPPSVPGVYPQQPAMAGQGGMSRRTLLIAGATAAGLVLVGGTALFLSRQPKSGTTTGPASNPAPAGTISLNFVYSTEKADWMSKAISDFNASNTQTGGKLIQVTADGRGSVETKDSILSGNIKPVAWSPASFLELNQLNTAWKGKNGKDIIYTSGDLIPKALVFSPLVFGIWKERAQILQRKYNSIDWQSISQAVALRSWGDIGGQSDWGQVKLGQTRPDQSNSGLLSITLQAYSFYKIQRGLTVTQIQSGDFLKYFQNLEGAVQLFGRSSGTYLKNEVITRGPASYDIIPIYENLILTNEQEAATRWKMSLVPFYPAVNIISDHPFAILNA
ncbi:MAG: protein kinase, partial [Ktedonobacteraceae bacterium]|nr:protein kinase [Ktedonobacteraceae bacterium]